MKSTLSALALSFFSLISTLSSFSLSLSVRVMSWLTLILLYGSSASLRFRRFLIRLPLTWLSLNVTATGLLDSGFLRPNLCNSTMSSLSKSSQIEHKFCTISMSCFLPSSLRLLEDSGMLNKTTLFFRSFRWFNSLAA